MDKFRYLIDLFESIDISEKGIEKVYDYLLLHKNIEDPKILQDELEINSFQRVYKILKVLKDLDLVQTVGRPMKAILNSPVEIWQKIISKKIEEIQHEASLKIKHCESTLEKMIEVYDLNEEEPDLPPVEFLNISNEFDSYDLLMKDIVLSCKNLSMAKDIHFEFPFLQSFNKSGKKLTLKPNLENYRHILERIQNGMKDISLRILFSAEYVADVIANLVDLEQNSPEIQKIEKEIFENVKFEIKVHQSAVGNFIVKDQKELMQYSIHPSNYLVGMFISRQDEITEIFKNKFDEKFSEAQTLDSYLKEKNMKILSFYSSFLLFTL